MATVQHPDWVAVGNNVAIVSDYYGKRTTRVVPVERHTPTRVVVDGVAFSRTMGDQRYRQVGTHSLGTSRYLAEVDDPEVIDMIAEARMRRLTAAVTRAAQELAAHPSEENAKAVSDAASKVTKFLQRS